MTFNDFKTKVKSLLLYDQDSSDPQVVSYIEALIAEWMADIQYYVENYRIGNTDTFLPAAIDVQCKGGRVDLPAELYKLESVAIVKQAEGGTVDAYIVSGAGTAAANGTYVRNGDSSSGRPAYTMYSTDGATALYNLWDDNAFAWFITSSGVDDTSGSSVLIYSVDSTSPTPPASGWFPILGDAPAPTLTIAPNLEGCETVIDLDPTTWDQRDEILNGKHCQKYAIDSRATEIYFSPIPEDDEETGETQWLRVEWDGTKVEYSGEEEVPYAQDCVKNCADFLNWNLALKKEDRPTRGNRFEAMFTRGRQRLFKTQRAKSQQG